MASIRREVELRVNSDEVWAAILDLGALPKLFPGVVANARMEGDMRVVTFVDGTELHERLVDINPVTRRMVVATVGGRIQHLNSAVQVFAEGQRRSRVIWVVDFLPNEIIDRVRDIVDREVAAARETLERPEQNSRRQP